MASEKITDYDIQALVDGELSSADELLIQRYIQNNDYARSRYNQLVQQKEILQNWWFKSLFQKV